MTTYLSSEAQKNHCWAYGPSELKNRCSEAIKYVFKKEKTKQSNGNSKSLIDVYWNKEFSPKNQPSFLKRYGRTM